MARVKMYRIQINDVNFSIGEPLMWTHKGQQFISTMNRPQAGLLFEDEIQTIRDNGFEVQILEEREFEEVR